MSVVRECCRQALGTSRGSPPDLDDEFARRTLSVARAHGVEPLVSSVLADSSAGDVAAVADERRRTAQSNLQAVAQARTVVDAFADRGIEALVYKGPVLAARAYGEVGRRAFDDIDLLVAPEDFDAAQDVLASRRYRVAERLDGLREVAFAPPEGYHVDLHATPIPRYFPGDLPFEDLWARHVDVDVAGTTLPGLAPADLFVVLAIHGTKHCWYRLSWICDVAALAEGVSWATVADRARASRSRRMVASAVALAEACLGASGPPARTFDVEQPVADRLADASLDRVLDPDPEPPEWGDRIRYQLQALDSAGDSARFLGSLAFAPTVADREFLDLPTPLTPLYAVVRPVRLAVRTLRRVLSGSP
ncbi:nucleotidyltransferase family protein [Halorientalis halophila]|uniref:nucleotidyltransferase domain-containing protein n=1 Tax=Halorientalis halophila TaxID=3108499 RepID=UPI00300986FA